MKMNEIKVIERLGNLLNVKVMVTWELVSKASGWMIQSDLDWMAACTQPFRQVPGLAYFSFLVLEGRVYIYTKTKKKYKWGILRI